MNSQIFYLQSDYPALQTLCQSNKRFNILCENQYLWKKKTELDFADFF